MWAVQVQPSFLPQVKRGRLHKVHSEPACATTVSQLTDFKAPSRTDSDKTLGERFAKCDPLPSDLSLVSEDAVHDKDKTAFYLSCHICLHGPWFFGHIHCCGVKCSYLKNTTWQTGTILDCATHEALKNENIGRQKKKKKKPFNKMIGYTQ